MDKQMMKNMAAKYAKEPALSKARAFLLVGVNWAATGMGDGLRIKEDFVSMEQGDSRRELKKEQDECLNALIKRYSDEQAQAVFQAVKEQIMEWEPDWTEEQVHKAAEMFLAQKGSV